MEMRVLKDKELTRERGGVVRRRWTETAVEGEKQLYRTTPRRCRGLQAVPLG